MMDAVQNKAGFRIHQDKIAVPSHQLHHHELNADIAQLIQLPGADADDPLHAHLLYRLNNGALAMLAQKHAEHGRLEGVHKILLGKMSPGIGGVGGEQQLPVGPLGAHLNDNIVIRGLVYFVNASAHTELKLLDKGMDDQSV
ncbi:hypothetical protein D3C75_823420 [compost metagenome]